MMKHKLVVNTARLYDNNRVSMEGHVQYSVLGLHLFKLPAKIIIPSGSPIAYLNGDPINDYVVMGEVHDTLVFLSEKRLADKLKGLDSAITSLHHP